MNKKQRQAIGVLTSGGDAQGMNAALRAVVRTAIKLDYDVYAIHEGYSGMVQGGAMFEQMFWESVGGIMDLGGTVIGTDRCREFQTRAGQKKAVLNLIRHGIFRLIVIGGDGSLTGADELSLVWSELALELFREKKITREKFELCSALEVVGLVGSIDNDMADIEMTIGVDSALHRITDAVDELSSTAASHQRIFVVEDGAQLRLSGADERGGDRGRVCADS